MIFTKILGIALLAGSCVSYACEETYYFKAPQRQLLSVATLAVKRELLVKKTRTLSEMRSAILGLTVDYTALMAKPELDGQRTWKDLFYSCIGLCSAGLLTCINTGIHRWARDHYEKPVITHFQTMSNTDQEAIIYIFEHAKPHEKNYRMMLSISSWLQDCHEQAKKEHQE